MLRKIIMQTIQARDINLRYLIDNFGIQLVRNLDFFPEWQNDLPELSEYDKQLLDKIKDGYFNLLNYPPLLEGIVRQAIVDPLLFIGDFYLAPFYVKSEESIDIEVLSLRRLLIIKTAETLSTQRKELNRNW